MLSKINRNDIFDKNLNFLLGSGASYGLLPTLAVGLKNSKTQKSHSIEALATEFAENSEIRTQLFSWYVDKVIKPASNFDLNNCFLADDAQELAVKNYERFLVGILTLLSKKTDRKTANIFTTNYDGMIAHVAEAILQNGATDFVVNDGGSGFIKRTLNAKNFNRFSRDQGVFGRYAKDVPQLNLLQLHGSVYWYKDGDKIEISYDLTRAKGRIEAVPVIVGSDFSDLLKNNEKNESDLAGFQVAVSEAEQEAFWNEYDKLPIVNPTKWKFHETVFEEHYYQMLRLLSYELEKPDSVLIVFGFSFADEHILNLVRRSLSNPTLTVFICCYDDSAASEFEAKFQSFENVKYICVDEGLDFTAFNAQVFNAEATKVEDAPASDGSK